MGPTLNGTRRQHWMALDSGTCISNAVAAVGAVAMMVVVVVIRHMPSYSQVLADAHHSLLVFTISSCYFMPKIVIVVERRRRWLNAVVGCFMGGFPGPPLVIATAHLVRRIWCH
ncbi:hypothetical protein B0T17DRAFT_81445 [Bombardia bombarda]|uniref:Uncharacterized protein n=1 Tax=Bombardia bombarda TaxID=252184 RepID=A0AA39XNB1_9PEZI|nr:hypothetical protein B0T17DRAFT_81445 [Bombardia bombarda]